MGKRLSSGSDTSFQLTSCCWQMHGINLWVAHAAFLFSTVCTFCKLTLGCGKCGLLYLCSKRKFKIIILLCPEWKCLLPLQCGSILQCHILTGTVAFLYLVNARLLHTTWVTHTVLGSLVLTWPYVSLLATFLGYMCGISNNVNNIDLNRQTGRDEI